MRESQRSVLWVREQRLAANNAVMTGDCRCGRKYAEQLQALLLAGFPMSDRVLNPLHPDVIEYAYRHGFFPMPHPDTGEVLWFDPDPRTVIPLDQFHVSRSLRRSRKTRGYHTTIDQAFMGVVRGCAARQETWINDEFIAMYQAMHRRQIAHSVEVWHDERLVGGVFGLNFNGVFNAESMFSLETDASKIALWTLVETMKSQGLTLLETQFMTPHLESLGAIAIPKTDYHTLLGEALRKPVFLVGFGPSF